MIPPTQESSTRLSEALNLIAVDGDVRVFDRAMAADTTFAVGNLVAQNAAGTLFQLSTIEHLDAAAWVANTVTAIGDVVVPTTGNGHYYECTARSGDYRTHAETEPTWPTNGSTIVDDGVTWTDRGHFDTRAGHFGICLETAVTMAEPAAWVANTEYALGALVQPTVPNGFYYECSARAGDYRSHATVEPTWPTAGGSVVDDQVTWEFRGFIHVRAAVLQDGAVRRAAITGLPPTSLPVGSVLGGLILC